VAIGSGDVRIDAYSGADRVKAKNIFGFSSGGSVFMTSGSIDVEVDGDIRFLATGSAKEAYISGIPGRDVLANNVYLKGYRSAKVLTIAHLLLRGDFVARKFNESGTGVSQCDATSILSARNIIIDSTRDATVGRVLSSSFSRVKEDIIVNADNDALLSGINYSSGCPVRNISLEGTNSARMAGFSAMDYNARGSIHLLSPGQGDIQCISLSAEKVFCDVSTAPSNSIINSTSTINVRGPIVTKGSTVPTAACKATNDITAGAIFADSGAGKALIESTSGSITVKGDIRTKSTASVANVSATNGNITARSIKTEAPTGQDDSIKAQAGSGLFQFVSTDSDVAMTIKDSEFDFDRDYEWNTALSVEGTCTIDGRGHNLNFGSSGAIIVTSGARLFLKNIVMDGISGTKVSCANNAASIAMENVEWNQTGDTTFSTGFMDIHGLHIRGPGTKFLYSSTVTSTIAKNASLIVDNKVTLSLDSNNSYAISMVDGTSLFNFDESVLAVAKDSRFIDGRLVFDNSVTFSVSSSKTLYFGDGNAAQNLSFDFHGASRLTMLGTITNQNV
jgi:hypothetical protein